MKPTLGQVFGLSLLGLIAVLAVLFYTVFKLSRETVIESSERIRDGASREIGERVTQFLTEAPNTVEQFQQEVDRGLVDARDPAAIEPALFALLLSTDDIAEMTFTYGNKLGFDNDGALQLAPTPRGQVSVVRALSAKEEDRFWSAPHPSGKWRFCRGRRNLSPLLVSPRCHDAANQVARIPDPTTHATFVTPAREDFSGQLLWSDLHWSQLDAALPESQRRVEVSVQQVVTDVAGEFVGVLRVGLLTQQLDRAVQLKLAPAGQADPHRIFICDAAGHLVTRVSPSDQLQESDGDLRIASANLPPEIVGALSRSETSRGGRKDAEQFGEFPFQ